MKPLHWRANCHDCGAKVGEKHTSGCDTEYCTQCGSQWIDCGCLEHRPSQSRWTGYFPGTLEAAGRGWFVKEQASGPRVRCEGADPEAEPDLNRWYADPLDCRDRARVGALQSYRDEEAEERFSSSYGPYCCSYQNLSESVRMHVLGYTKLSLVVQCLACSPSSQVEEYVRQLQEHLSGLELLSDWGAVVATVVHVYDPPGAD